MTFEQYVAFMLTLGAMVTGIMELVKNTFLKPARERNQWPEAMYNGVVIGLSYGFGIVVAFLAGPEANVLPQLGLDVSTPFLQIVGTVLAGFAIGLGNQYTHEFLNIVQAVGKLVRNYRDPSTSA